MFNVVSSTFLQRTTIRAEKITELLMTFHTLNVLLMCAQDGVMSFCMEFSSKIGFQSLGIDFELSIL